MHHDIIINNNLTLHQIVFNKSVSYLQENMRAFLPQFFDTLNLQHGFVQVTL